MDFAGLVVAAATEGLGVLPSASPSPSPAGRRGEGRGAVWGALLCAAVAKGLLPGPSPAHARAVGPPQSRNPGRTRETPW